MQMLIDGAWTDAADGSVQEITNPSTNETIDTVPKASLTDIERAVAAAVDAKQRAARTPAHERARVLIECASELEANREELAVLLAKENGKPIRQTRDEISAAARIFRGFGEEAKRIFGRSMSLDMVPGMERHFAVTIRRPVGVVAAIVPFNYPVELYAHKAAAALAGGNAVVVKPPSDCPLTVMKIGEILEKVGIPKGTHQVVTGPGAVIGDFLAKSKDVQLISVTGSTEVGRKISRLAAENLKQVHLELGGNDAGIVCVDADLENAANAVILGRLARGNGQICCAMKRVYVASEVSEDFSKVLSQKTKALKVGDPLEETTDVGPLISEQAAVDVERDIKEAISLGAQLHAGGTRNGAFVSPTVLSGVTQNARMLQNETFGPVVPIVPFTTLDEAIELANASVYGLQAAVFTKELSNALDIAYRMDAGGVIINWSSAVRVENLPFGGVKLSGHGRESIHDTLNEMTEQKTVLMYDALSIYEPKA